MTVSIILSACKSNQDEINQNILTTAWLTCESATGVASGGSFDGKAVLVWNLHPEMDPWGENNPNHYEQVGSMWLTNAPYFILGDYDETNYYPDYDSNDFLTLNFDEAGAFLCVSITYKDIETCNYESGFYIKRALASTNVKLVSWPDKKLIAETSINSSTPDGCAILLNTRYLGDHLVKVNNIDIWKWFLNYK